MSEAQPNNKITLQKYYDDGYSKGFHDGIIGLKMKLMPHTRSLSSEYISSWEAGYKQGYLEGRHQS